MTTGAPEPIDMVYEGDGFKFAGPFWQKRADKFYVIGQRYRMVDEPERSHASHSHYFACLADAWRNLPDALLEQYPSIEVLRKKMLIKTGFCSERSIVCASKAEALRMAAFIAQMDTYAVVIPRMAMVSVYTAESQSARAMGKERFQASKTAVLEAVSDLIGVTSNELSQARAG